MARRGPDTASTPGVPRTASSLNLDPNAHGKEIHTKYYDYGEEPGVLEPRRPWPDREHAQVRAQGIHGQDPHAVARPRSLWTVNVNLLNNSKYHYDMVKNVDPNIECIVVQDLEMTSGVNYADVAMAINSWMEFTYPEMVAPARIPGCRSGRAASSRCMTPGTTWTPMSSWPRNGRRCPVTSGSRTPGSSSSRTRWTSTCSGSWTACQHDLWLQRQGVAAVGEGLVRDGADLSARAVLGAGQRIEADVDAHRAVRELPGRAGVPSSTARTSSCTGRIRRARRTCRT